MKKIAIVLSIAAVISSCNETVEKEVLDTVVTQEKVQQEPTDPKDTEVWEPKRNKVNPKAASGVPSDAIVLFDGSNLDAWESAKDKAPAPWILNKNGSMTVADKTGDIQTKQTFGSVQLHIEWRSSPENKQTNQNRSNSGVFLQKLYEVQVLDNNDNDTYINGMVGSVYKQNPPLVMASMPTGEWNAYDIIFHAPEFDGQGKKTKDGTLTVLNNGVLIQDHFVLEGTTEYIGWPKNPAHGKAPIQLQDHGDMSGVSYRNIWVRELD